MGILLAQAMRGGDVSVGLPWSLGQILITIVIVAACIALTWVALRRFGITIPGWAVEVFWIVAIAFVVILGIRVVLAF